MFLFEPTIQSPTRLTIQSTTPLQLFAIGLQNLRYIQPTVSSRFVLTNVSYSVDSQPKLPGLFRFVFNPLVKEW